MKLPVLKDQGNLCEQCVALCCRYFAFSIEKPKTRRDFEDVRWFLLHEDAAIFVEEGDWYVQINRKCKALLPDNRCGIYEKRPSICREYKTDGCDWQSDDYGYDELFTEPEQIERYMKEHLARQRKRRQARRKQKAGPIVSRQKPARRAGAGKAVSPVRLLKSA